MRKRAAVVGQIDMHPCAIIRRSSAYAIEARLGNIRQHYVAYQDANQGRRRDDQNLASQIHHVLLLRFENPPTAARMRRSDLTSDKQDVAYGLSRRCSLGK